MQESNWFSAPSALRVYGQYLNLDKDHNGMLSKEELARYVLKGKLYSNLIFFDLHLVFNWLKFSIDILIKVV